MAQLVERSLPTPEICGSNPDGQRNFVNLFIINCVEKKKIKKKRPGMAHFFNLWP